MSLAGKFDAKYFGGLISEIYPNNRLNLKRKNIEIVVDDFLLLVMVKLLTINRPILEKSTC